MTPHDLMALDEEPSLMHESQLDMELDPQGGLQDSAMQEAEEIARYEYLELEALADLAPELGSGPLPDNSGSSTYDDDDYDSLFMEFVMADTDKNAMDVDLDINRMSTFG